MKTKKVSRVLALLLSLVMLLGALPMTALAESSVVVSDADYAEKLFQAAQIYYERAMACETIEAFEAVNKELLEQQGLNFFKYLSQDQQNMLNQRVNELIDIYEAEHNVEPPIEGIEDDREIVFPTVDFTDAAPFGDPVVGEAPIMRMLMSTRASGTEETDNGFETDKYISTPDENGQYILTLEAWATGAKTTTIQEKNVPTDIVLVLDQSGSMDTEDFYKTTYSKFTGTPESMYNTQSTLYVKLPNGSYAPLSIKRQLSVNGYTPYKDQSNGTYYSNGSNLYHACPDGTYGKVTVNRQWNGFMWWGEYEYTYTCAECNVLGSSSGEGTTPSDFDDSLYLGAQEYEYTFSYTNSAGEIVTEKVKASQNAPVGWEIYQATTSGDKISRLQALKDAVSVFVDQVAIKARGNDGQLGTEDDVDHTISVVGFANYSNYQDYNNTEIFIGSTEYKYGSAARGQYANAPQDMSDEQGIANVKASINKLDANGATYVDLGIEMANGILNANKVPAGETRNRVVIVFTDGVPGYSGKYGNGKYGDQGNNAQAVADAAMTQIDTTKNTHKASVYTVGIFDGADASKDGSNGNNATAEQRANYFMHRLSSNTSYPQTPSYYLSASDSVALTSIFKTISQNIENGGTVVTLDEDTIVKDVLTEQFELPEGATKESIMVYTAGVDETTGEFVDREQWVEFTDADVNINGRTITVSNFDYAENWVGSETDTSNNTTYRGQKLIIMIPIVVREDFLGGNQVLTNAEGSAVYENAEAVNNNVTVEEFESPKVDIAIGDITVAAPDYNVYLLGGVDLDQIKGDLEIKVGNVELDMDPTANNYGLEAWQNAYVEIGGSNNATGYSNLTGDQTYKVTCSVTPTETGTVSGKDGEDTGSINVFKPELTFKDGQVDYMSAIDGAKYLYNNTEKTYEVNNRDGNAVWKHGETVATNMGNPPALSLAYNPTSGVVNNNVTSTTYVPMQVTVKIGDTPVTEHVTFKHTETCPDTACEWESVTKKSKGNPAFLLHVENVNGDLKITKTVNWNGKYDEAQTFLFKVEGKKVDNSSIDPIWVSISFTYSDGKTKSETIIVEDLPAGTYTVTEIPADQRYTMSAEGNTGMVVNGTVIPEAKFTNTLINDKWLDDEYSVDNTFNDVTTQESTN